MRRNKQLTVDAKKGDCFRACLTSILDIPNDPKLPNVDDPEWMMKWYRILRRFGLHLGYSRDACWKSGYWIATVKSKNYEGGTHAIVMRVGEVVHDPSTKKRYKTGEQLVTQEVVRGGYSLEVLDPKKLHLLSAWRKKKYGVK